MKFNLLFSGLFASVLTLTSFNEAFATNVDYRVIPMPQKIEVVENQKPFTLNKKSVIRYTKGNDKLKKDAEFLSSYIKEVIGLKLSVKAGNASTGINLIVDNKIDNKEGYIIDVNSSSITIKGGSEAGVFYGIQTLRKSLTPGISKSVEMPAAHIEDYPRFAYRGAHLDVSRHFFPADSVKKFIDMLALHNVNRFHWHLSDDQGWRIEIKSRPELITKGSERKETVIGHNSGKYDGKPYGGFYTQEQAKDIVKYAAERNITVIPEIDMPGHMQAALAAYPELGCTGGPYDIWTIWGVSDNVLCAGNDATLKFIDDVLGEIVQMFPSEYIHVGGDECPKDQWKVCPKCQARIKQLGIVSDEKHTAEEKLQSYIISHAEKFLNSRGRQIIGWDEILEGGLAPNATVMSWRGEGGGIEAAKQVHDVIMSPNTYLYFDYYQTKDKENEPDAIGGYLPVETVYNYEPMPKSLTKEEQKFIKGVQANLWTEYIPTYSQVEYMELPRLAALSEVQWSNPENKDYKDFLSRLVRYIELYKVKGYNYATHIFDVFADFTPNTDSGKLDITLSTIDDSPIYYTLDGTDPTEKSNLYQSVLNIDKDCTFKAVSIRKGVKSRTVTENIGMSKASMKPITMRQPINKQYEYKGAVTLVDGLKGNGNYKTGRWIAFYKNDLEAIIDLTKEEEISKVDFTTCVEKGDWVFDARSAEILLSDDGNVFKTVAEENYPEMNESDRNGLYNHTISFPAEKAKFVKIKIAPEHKIPEWHGGKGNNGFLFIDEIEIN